MRPCAALPIAVYRPRRIGALSVREIAGWQVKLIGITAGQDLPGAAEREAAVGYAARRLPQPRTWTGGRASRSWSCTTVWTRYG